MKILQNLQKKLGALIFLVRKGIDHLTHFGLLSTLKKTWQKFFERRITPMPDLPEISTSPAQMPQPTREEPYKFSIVTPLFNTPGEFLKELISSVQAQLYTNWELCFADGSDPNNSQVQTIVSQAMDSDERIKYCRLNKNQGMALNTIAAYAMATGEYIVLLDHDDFLTSDALWELASAMDQNPTCDVLYSDRAIFSNETKQVLAYHYLPGFSPDYLRGANYMSHLNAFSRHVIERVGFERPGYDGSQDYDLVLRCTEAARKICHIPKVLYWCRASEGSVALNPQSKMYAYEAAQKAIAEHLIRIGYPGEVEFLPDIYAYRIHYALPPAKVSILIPNKDHVNDLRKCLTSILTLSTYQDYEIIIAENNSQEVETFEYYQTLESDPRVRVIHTGIKGFNYSALNNFAAQQASGEYLLFLNNDTEVITPNWIEEMLMFAQRKDVGAVGVKLLYPNKTLQHCGLIIGLAGNIASHYGFGKPSHEKGYMNTLALPQNYSALTAACLMVKRSDYLAVDGLDEVHFAVGLNDVDFCLKLVEKGLINVWTPYAQLFHYESATRGSDFHGESKLRFEGECAYFRVKWEKYFTQGDTFDTVNFKGW